MPRLEAVAEDVGVDPRCTTPPGRWQAFLDKATVLRMAGLPRCLQAARTRGRAALAALLPNTFLQALVWQA